MAINGVQDIETTVYGQLDSNWTETSIVYDNTKYNPTTENEYISVFVNPADEIPAANAGSQNLYRIVGEAVFPVYSEQGKGSGRNKELADKVAQLFRGKNINGVQFRGATINRVGVTDEGGWYRSNVRIEFYADLYQ